MLLARVFSVVLCAGVLFVSGCSKREQPPISVALDYAVKGEWAKADKPSAEAVRKTPDNINALILRALVCENLNRYDEAVENAYKAATVDSNSFAAIYTLGRLYGSRLRNEAVNLLIKASRLRSDSPLPLILLCNLHPTRQKGSYLAALKMFPEYANAPEVEFESFMVKVYNRDRRGVEAAYIRLFENHPNHPDLTSALGGYFYFTRKYDLAKAAYKRYLSFPEEKRTSNRTDRALQRLAKLK
jgi:tetratricopeptide (TPR) repeat protein